jgi:RNA polymerase sigma-70 factor (ECF subfamily)
VVISGTRHRIVELLPRLRRFSYALTGGTDTGDDLVQETCARALSRLDQWEPGTRLDSWMFRIAQNIWLDQRRSHKVRGETADIDQAYDIPGDDGRDVVESRLTLKRVSQGIAQMPADQQVLIALVCVDGLSYKEAAEILDVPIGTVMSRLARARRALHDVTDGELSAAPVIKLEIRRGHSNR